MRECSPPTMCHMSRVACHVSRVICHVSHVTCHMSCVTCHMSHVTFFVVVSFVCFLQTDGVSRLRVCYQRGLPRLFFFRCANFSSFDDRH